MSRNRRQAILVGSAHESGPYRDTANLSRWANSGLTHRSKCGLFDEPRRRATTKATVFGPRVAYKKRGPPGVATALASIAIRCEDRQCDFAISNVVVDSVGDEIFAGFMHFHRLDRSIFSQLADDIVALYICIRIRRVGDLK